MDMRYPIGHFKQEEVTADVINIWINEIERAPEQLKNAVKDLTDDQLDTPYRHGGWTVRQLVHHLADSHINAYVRFKLSLTENNPMIKPYREEKWAELSDYTLPIQVSLTLLEALHSRWVALLRSIKSSDLDKTFHHPDSGSTKVGINIGIYAWHGRHHIAHISALRERLDW